jgi:hypothetical protein
MAYLIKPGSGVALVDLVAFTQQPSSGWVMWTRRTYAAGGGVYDESPYVELVFDMLLTPAAYVAMLTLAGVNSALTAAVTVYVPNQYGTFARYDGVAVQPFNGADLRRRDYFIHDVKLLVKNLVAL